MRYIDWDDVTRRYSDVARTIDATELQAAYVDDAEAEVDARLAVRYTVPLANTPTLTPSLVRGLCVDLTYFKVMLGKKDMEALKTYIDARFKALIDGDMTLVGSGGVPVEDSPLVWGQTSRYSTAFGPDDPVCYDVSSQWTGDVQTDRSYR